jgi:hypothetical protein
LLVTIQRKCPRLVNRLPLVLWCPQLRLWARAGLRKLANARALSRPHGQCVGLAARIDHARALCLLSNYASSNYASMWGCPL